MGDFGLKVGLSNFCAAYCTGLLCARRILRLKGLDKKYPGVEEVTGEPFELKEDENVRPFKALLDIGLANPTVGNKVFACLKGAVDGGLYVPHSDKRFSGYDKGAGRWTPRRTAAASWGSTSASTWRRWRRRTTRSTRRTSAATSRRASVRTTWSRVCGAS